MFGRRMDGNNQTEKSLENTFLIQKILNPRWILSNKNLKEFLKNILSGNEF